MKSIEKQQNDIFAEIATQRVKLRDSELVEPKPVKIPAKILPWDKTVTKRNFAPYKSISTAKELELELKKQRNRHEKFLENYAPKLLSKRIIKKIDQFNWRIETTEDKNNFLTTLNGNGNWEKVTIPHYGPPLGRAVTYYRTKFEITQEMMTKGALFIHFEGVDYKAHVFINNTYLGSHEGFFAPFEFEFTSYAKLGENVLLVRVENDFIFMGSRSDQSATRFEGEKLYAATGCGWDDPEIGWHHCPPGMGIYQDVFIEARKRVFIQDIFVRPILKEKVTEAWIEVFNCDFEPKTISLELSVYGQNFKKTIIQKLTYQPQSVHVPGLGDVVKSDNSKVTLSVESGVNLFKIRLPIKNPRFWAPETPWLYQLQVNLLDEEKNLLDSEKQQFGMRDFRMDESKKIKGGFFLNGQPIKLRGANTMGHLQQCVIKKNWKQLQDDILLAKICNMNFLRFTQRPVQPEIYEMCDKLGILTQTDLPLFGVLRRNKVTEALRQVEEMERLVRKHACNILVTYINEPFPNAMDKPHRHLTRVELENFFKAADLVVKATNPDRVIKATDGEYDPPGPGLPDNHCYCGWYIGHGIDLGKLHKGFWQLVKPNWYFGCGEFGAEGLDPASVMKKYYPKNWLPKSKEEEKVWNPDQIVMAQTGQFHYLWFDTQNSLDDWVKESHAHQSWIIKLMTEAFRRNRMMNSFAIHLFIDAFPAGWMKTIVDVDRQPKPAYFAYKDVLTPLIVNLRSDQTAFFSGDTIQAEAWICNDKTEVLKKTKLVYQFELESKIIKTGQIITEVPVFDSKCQGILKIKVPKVSERKTGKFLLKLINKNNVMLHQTKLSFEIFPKLVKSKKKPIKLISSKKGKALQLVKNLKLPFEVTNIFQEKDTILIDDYALFEKFSKSIEKEVKNGALVVFLELPVGEFFISQTKVKVEKCGMGPRHFVSRKTRHPLVKDFQPDDFKFWYDNKVDYPTPLLSTVFEAKDWEPILTSGNGDWQGNWKPALAAAEKKDGLGMWRICQVHLSNRIQGNPVATIFARRLLTKTILTAQPRSLQASKNREGN
jgi:hypothetical protein